MATFKTESSKLAPKSKETANKSGKAVSKRARTPRRLVDAPAVVSPAATGPSRALLEGHVGAQYLLPSATLELQATRTIAFTANDEVFADVVALACRTAAKPDFGATRYELAVAIARTSTRGFVTLPRWSRRILEMKNSKSL